jgi:hypothetical protein
MQTFLLRVVAVLELLSAGAVFVSEEARARVIDFSQIDALESTV